jgi:hypothetical protein
MYTIPIWFGLFFTGLYVLHSSQIITEISNNFENFLGAAMTLAAAACLVGTRLNNVRKAYITEIAGLLVICIVLGILAIATELTLIQQFTLAGGLGALIQIGSLRMIFRLTLELKHKEVL